MKKKLSVVIAAFNEESYIEQVLSRVLAVDLRRHIKHKELIVVDDGSTDGTYYRILKFMRSKVRGRHKLLRDRNGVTKLQTPSWSVTAYRQPINRGKGSAIRRAIGMTHGDLIIIQDADLEYSPDNYPFLLEPFYLYQADAVYGSRFVTHLPRRILYYWHYLANTLLTTLSNICTNLNFSGT